MRLFYVATHYTSLEPCNCCVGVVTKQFDVFAENEDEAKNNTPDRKSVEKIDIIDKGEVKDVRGRGSLFVSSEVTFCGLYTESPLYK